MNSYGFHLFDILRHFPEQVSLNLPPKSIICEIIVVAIV